MVIICLVPQPFNIPWNVGQVRKLRRPHPQRPRGQTVAMQRGRWSQIWNWAVWSFSWDISHFFHHFVWNLSWISWILAIALIYLSRCWRKPPASGRNSGEDLHPRPGRGGFYLSIAFSCWISGQNMSKSHEIWSEIWMLWLVISHHSAKKETAAPWHFSISKVVTGRATPPRAEALVNIELSDGKSPSWSSANQLFLRAIFDSDVKFEGTSRQSTDSGGFLDELWM